jgi:hypothetical protein
VGRMEPRHFVRAQHTRNQPGEDSVPKDSSQRVLNPLAQAVRRMRKKTELPDDSCTTPDPVAPSSSAAEARTSVFEPESKESTRVSEPSAARRVPMPQPGDEPTLLVGTRLEPTRQYPLVAQPAAPAHETASTPLLPPRIGKPPIFWAVVVVGAMVLLLSAVVIVLSVESNSRPAHTSPTIAGGSPARPVTRPTSPTAAPSRQGAPTTSTPATTPPTTVTTPSSTEPVSVAGGSPPELGSIAPAAGSAGQSVVISGANLFSADGLVQAFFGMQDAPISCPSQTSCTVVVPNLSGPPRGLQVTVSTESGTSNALSFYYL